MSRRPEQAASTLKRALQERIARGLADPRVQGMVTVTGVDLSPDLKTASVSVSIYPESAESVTMHGLRAAARHLRREVGEMVAMRQLPEFTFRLDHSLKKQAAVLDAISRASAERRAKEGSPDQPIDGSPPEREEDRPT